MAVAATVRAQTLGIRYRGFSRIAVEHPRLANIAKFGTPIASAGFSAFSYYLLTFAALIPDALMTAGAGFGVGVFLAAIGSLVSQKGQAAAAAEENLARADAAEAALQASRLALLGTQEMNVLGLSVDARLKSIRREIADLKSGIEKNQSLLIIRRKEVSRQSKMGETQDAIIGAAAREGIEHDVKTLPGRIEGQENELRGLEISEAQTERSLFPSALITDIEELGKGGMGQVQVGYCPKLGKKVVLKTMLSDKLDKEALREAKERFKREALSQSQIFDPNVAKIYGYSEETKTDSGGQTYIVYTIYQEYIEGMDLTKYLDALEGRPRPVIDILSLFLQIAKGVAATHAKNIIHRDLKPDNVRVSGLKFAKLIDFGIAKAAKEHGENAGGTQLTASGNIIGTPQYMAPEQILPGGSRRIGPKTDVFALGIILFEMLTGKRPYQGTQIDQSSGAWEQADEQSLQSLQILLRTISAFGNRTAYPFPVISKTLGEHHELQILVERMTENNVEQRIPLSEAIKEINELIANFSKQKIFAI
ncbi:serine/threonine protein kinase [Candidatus Saganbacteria bacterium]|nr:serine/threonine protein kinase [Candidatus Saganbacteria bacterium]